MNVASCILILMESFNTSHCAAPSDEVINK